MSANRYFLNGLDMYTTYGLIVEDGSDSILVWPEAKERKSHTWRERDGKQYNLIAPPTYNDKQIELRGCIVAENEAQFWQRYNALFAAFDVPGTVAINCVELGKVINVFYLKMPHAKRLTRIKNTNLIGVEITLLLQEVL